MVLLLQQCHNYHQRFDQARALGTLRATTAFAPQHPGAHRPLGRVVQRLDAFQRHTRPQRRTQLEARPTDALGLRGATRAASFEPLFDLPTQRALNAPKARPLQWPIADAMPPGKPLTPMALQGFPDFLGASTASTHRINVPQQMRPTELTPPPWIPVVCTPAIGDHDISDRRPQEGTGRLAPTRQAPQQHRASGRHGLLRPAGLLRTIRFRPARRSLAWVRKGQVPNFL
jgi:hypothetical protein